MNENIIDAEIINKSLENIVNKMAVFHFKGDIIKLSYPLGEVQIIFK